MSTYRCPLGALQPKEIDKERVKSKAWNDDGWLVIHRDDPDLHWAERATIEAIGNRKFGNPGRKKS